MFNLSLFRRSAAFKAAFCGVFITCGLFTLGGCGSGGHSTPSPTPTPISGTMIDQPGWSLTRANKSVQPTRKWTYLVYMNAANDLEEFAPLNIHQMEQTGSTNEVNIAVQCQRSPNYATTNGNWSDARRYFITKQSNLNNIDSPLLSQKDSAKIDMGNASELQAFIKWGVSTFPAQKYCLVLWDHGAGWRSVPIKKAKSRGFSYNYDTGTHIDTIEFPAAIDMGNGRKWDVLAFDSSLLQMAEVDYEVRDKANIIVGSEESPPGEGYPYNLFLASLAANPNQDGTTLASNMAQSAIDQYGTNSIITQSVIDASKLGDIAPALNELGANLLRVKNTYGPQIISARNNADSYEFPYTENKDLLDFLHYLVDPPAGSTVSPIPDAGVQAAALKLRSVVSASILKNVNGDGHSGSRGLALFIPSPLAYAQVDREQADGMGQRYNALALAKAAPNWQSFLANGPQ